LWAISAVSSRGNGFARRSPEATKADDAKKAIEAMVKVLQQSVVPLVGK